MVKILRGVNKRTETDLKEISGDIWQKTVKIGKNTEGVIKPNINKKMPFIRLQKIKKSCYDDDKKIKKIKKTASRNTVFTPTRRQKPTHKSPTAAGMREHNRSAQSKKNTVLRFNERK